MNTHPGSTVRTGKNRDAAGLVLAIFVAIFTGQSLSGATAYLPVTGPAPLRFELATARGASLAWLAQHPLRPITNAVVTATLSTTNTATNTVVAVARPTVPMTAGAGPFVLPPPPGMVVVPYQSDDTIGGVSPQVLATYFRPTPGWHKPDGQNPQNPQDPGAAVGAMMPVGFLPPTPKSALENRATYHSQ